MSLLRLSQPEEIPTQRLRLVPFSSEHLTPRYISWLNDQEVMKFSEHRHETNTLATGRAYWQSFQGTNNFLWAIEARDSTLGHIGTMTAYLDIINEVADMGIMIGNRLAWGKGYGLESWQALGRWLLEEAGVRKITAGTMADNKAMLAIMNKAGMVPDGVRKAQVLLDGQPVDIVYSALFKT